MHEQASSLASHDIRTFHYYAQRQRDGTSRNRLHVKVGGEGFQWTLLREREAYASDVLCRAQGVAPPREGNVTKKKRRGSHDDLFGFTGSNVLAGQACPVKVLLMSARINELHCHLIHQRTVSDLELEHMVIGAPYVMPAKPVDMTFTPGETVALLAALCLAVYGLLYRQNASATPLPGPRGYPLFGNLFQLSRKRPHIQLQKWADEYGEIYRVHLGTLDMVVLNTAAAADELLVHRSRHYSSRVPPYVAHEILSDSQRLVLMPYTREAKISRRTIQGAIGAGPCNRLKVYHDLESRVTLRDLLDHGDKSFSICLPSSTGELHVPDGHWFMLIRRYATSLILNVTYGRRVHTLENFPELHGIYDVVETFGRVSQPGEYLQVQADTIPFLRRFPDWLSPWRARARGLHEKEMSVWGSLFDAQKASWKAGTESESLIASYLTARAVKSREEAPGRGILEDGWMRDKFLLYTAASMLEAGAETTSTTAEMFILFMLMHPHILKKAQEEMDRVVGPDRLPTFEDEPNLPYVVACIKETMRRRPVIPMGVPHMAAEDDVYKGYFIPKGAVIVGNIFATGFTSLGKPASLRSGNSRDCDRDHYTFGWGRRFCVGFSFAEASLFILCARIVWAFDIYPMKDKETGKPVVPDIMDETGTYSDGMVSAPLPFNVGWKARDIRRAELIRQAFDEAQEEWKARGMQIDQR
ncbi:hypothetical protein NM688_g1517 [Phlebia brevispora]|uniref:Uncharacterized protein n=1 Tax=Phlebia brevispora TaxID=194682 RepID=A0ACC1TBD7_9APHY|nr:hypothetical protein NM688_g1517 [Phlebia brevispora]